ncbi:MAG: DMT family transporter [Proteobacteria bacterium]|nr:DMT family transporter [Pseudomonadota bacterium]
MNRGITYALLAAALFGASTPFAKQLVGEVQPLLLAGLLYLGSGLGLAIFRCIRDRGWRPPGLTRRGWAWLLAAILFGGVLGPAALMYGLTHAGAAQASLLLNLEAVLTAMIAWVVFRENADRRVVLGMVAIVAGGVLLSWPSAQAQWLGWLGPLAISLAALSWAIDNNLTRQVATDDALFIAGLKGLVAGFINTGLALAVGARLPPVDAIAGIFLVGLLGYGASLVLFVLALRGLGVARTGAYFSVAPFVGAALSIAMFGEATTPLFWIAAGMMAIGVWLHATEVHDHWHWHGDLHHRHPHYPDAEHRHRH